MVLAKVWVAKLGFGQSLYGQRLAITQGGGSVRRREVRGSAFDNYHFNFHFNFNPKITIVVPTRVKQS